MNIETIYEFCVALPEVKEEFPFGEDILVFKTHGKIFFLCFLEGIPLRINLKCQPDLALELRDLYPNKVVEGYYMNKKHWNTVFVEDLPTDLVKKMIIHSYEEVLSKLPLKIRKKILYEFQKPFEIL